MAWKMSPCLFGRLQLFNMDAKLIIYFVTFLRKG